MSFFSDIFKKQISAEVKKTLSLAVSKIPLAVINRYGNGSWSALSSSGGGEKTRNGLANSGALINLNHTLLRRNARKAFHETPAARMIVERFANTIADIGLTLEPTPKADVLGKTEEEIEKWSKDVEERFDLWAKSKRQHRAGNINFYQLQRLYQIGQHRDNDVFVRLYYSNDKSLLSPLQFEMIDPDQLKMDSLTNSSGYSTKVDGIIRNEKGEEIAYEIYAENPAQPGVFRNVKIIAKDKNRIYMLHGFTPEYAGQGRGYSRLGYAIQDFEHLTDFEIAQIEKAIAQSVMAFTVESDDETAPQTLDLSSVGIDSASGVPPTTNPVTGEDYEYRQLREATFKESGSAIVIQPKGKQKLKSVPNTAPSDSYDSFMMSKITSLSAAVSMPVEVALMRFNSNYSASRAALIMYWTGVVMWRQEMATDLLNPAYEMWLSEEIAAGRIKAPGWSNPTLRAAWINSRWVGSSVPNIDPLKTAQAEKENVALGATTLKRVARNLNGSDYNANASTLAREMQRLNIPPWESKTKSEPDKKEDEEDNDE